MGCCCVLGPRLSPPNDLPATRPPTPLIPLLYADDANPGLLPEEGAGGGGPLLEPKPLRDICSRMWFCTAILAAFPAALPAAAVARSVIPVIPPPPLRVCVEAGVGKRCGRVAKYSSNSPKNACFSPAGRFAIMAKAAASLRHSTPHHNFVVVEIACVWGKRGMAKVRGWFVHSLSADILTNTGRYKTTSDQKGTY